MSEKKEHTWLKSKGYLHITAQIDVQKREHELVAKITNPNFVSRYAFYPLIHTNINERRYKRLPHDSSKRAHSYIDEEKGPVRNIKCRPLHYATHLDAMIFSYYAQVLQEEYEKEIAKYNTLCDCIIAYRKIPSDVEGKHKSTIHFAKEIFDEIKIRAAKEEECVVLTFDIKSFFSNLNHARLKDTWAKVLGVDRLPDDHYNVFRASTLFSYIYLDELRLGKKYKGRRPSFDEKELARIRNKHGIHAFFESPKAFRDKVKDGSVKLYKYPFRDKETKEPIGIPQGLPISATLANLYLLEFDKKVLEEVVCMFGGYYRRYSDDIVVVCSRAHAVTVEEFILEAIKESKVKISTEKTERFLFKKVAFGKKEPRLTSIKLNEQGEHIGSPFNYLGFEFNGQKALIKSANLGKFYRRMIQSVKRKAKRAKKEAEKTPGAKPYIHRRQLYKLYTAKPLTNTKVRSRWKKIVQIENGDFRLKTGIKNKELRSNYLTYVRRASEIMEEPAIENQIRKHKAIFNRAIHKHLNKNK
jgi:hypothetical protein